MKLNDILNKEYFIYKVWQILGAIKLSSNEKKWNLCSLAMENNEHRTSIGELVSQDRNVFDPSLDRNKPVV